MVESRALIPGDKGWRVERSAMDDVRSSRHAAEVLARRIALHLRDQPEIAQRHDFARREASQCREELFRPVQLVQLVLENVVDALVAGNAGRQRSSDGFQGIIGQKNTIRKLHHHGGCHTSHQRQTDSQDLAVSIWVLILIQLNEMPPPGYDPGIGNSGYLKFRLRHPASPPQN